MANWASLHLEASFPDGSDADGWFCVAKATQERQNGDEEYTATEALDYAMWISGVYRKDEGRTVVVQGECKWGLAQEDAVPVMRQLRDAGAGHAELFQLEPGNELCENYVWDASDKCEVRVVRLPARHWPKDAPDATDAERGYDSFDEEVERRLSEHGVSRWVPIE